jgi:putative transposase
VAYFKVPADNWNKHFWSPGYCVSTVGLNKEQIEKYVRWQQKKDQAMEELGQQNMFVMP